MRTKSDKTLEIASNTSTTKVGKKQKPKRKYNLINDNMRADLIKYIVEEKLNIVIAAEKAGINYENAKAIYRIYRTQGRLNKKKQYLTQSKRQRLENDFEKVFKKTESFYQT